MGRPSHSWAERFSSESAVSKLLRSFLSRGAGDTDPDRKRVTFLEKVPLVWERDDITLRRIVGWTLGSVPPRVTESKISRSGHGTVRLREGNLVGDCVTNTRAESYSPVGVGIIETRD